MNKQVLITFRLSKDQIDKLEEIKNKLYLAKKTDVVKLMISHCINNEIFNNNVNQKKGDKHENY
ncbi:MAG: hypothetical protein QXL94_04030 [Candidatus Parvarchaeum sp.]